MSRKLFVLKWSVPCDQDKFPGQSEVFIENEPSIESLRDRLDVLKMISANSFKVLECGEYQLLCEIDLSNELGTNKETSK